jgi:hypothetical protein
MGSGWLGAWKPAEERVSKGGIGQCWWLMPVILAWGNSLWDSILKKAITKKGWYSGSRWRPWVQTPVLFKKKI